MKLKIIQEPKLGAIDLALLLIFFIGIYLGVIVQITSTIPFPSAPSGIAGMILLWRRRDDIVPPHLGALLGIVLLYLLPVSPLAT